MKFQISNLKHRKSKAASGGSIRNVWSRLWSHPLAALVPAVLIFALGGPAAKAQVSREYQIKAAFLYNFAQFTDWPETAFADEKAPIIIAILGNDPFGRTLDDTIKGETVQGHPLAVVRYRSAEDVKTCDILFISQSETRHTGEVVKSLKGKPVLTVADTDAPASGEAIIRFLVETNKVHFRINREAARAAHLALSSRLLRVADATPPGRVP